MQEDFKHVLQASVQKQWEEVRRAMSAFTYFDALDEVARREGCIVAKMKAYNVDDIILGDGVGIPNFVYFILSGRCQMIETLQVTVTQRLGRTSYALYDPYVPKEESEQDLDTKYFGAYKDLNKSKDIQSPADEKDLSASRLGSKRLESILRYPDPKQERSSIIKQDSVKTEESANSIHSPGIDTSVTAAISTLNAITEDGAEPPLAESSTTTYEMLSMAHTEQKRDSVRFSIGPPLIPNFRTYFMQVCRYYPGSTFGFGENMRDRRIIAITPVDCMLMPKIWLLQRNTANIWSRIQHFLEKKIPTKKQLFEDFVAERRWQEFRDQLVGDVVARSKTVNTTSLHDVPYSIRMEEMIDI